MVVGILLALAILVFAVIGFTLIIQLLEQHDEFTRVAE
jgi:hypothetical protein